MHIAIDLGDITTAGGLQKVSTGLAIEMHQRGISSHALLIVHRIAHRFFLSLTVFTLNTIPSVLIVVLLFLYDTN